MPAHARRKTEASHPAQALGAFDRIVNGPSTKLLRIGEKTIPITRRLVAVVSDERHDPTIALKRQHYAGEATLGWWVEYHYSRPIGRRIVRDGEHGRGIPDIHPDDGLKGQPLPEETVIGVDIGYATAVFAIPDNAPADWTAVMIFDPPAEGGLAGIMLPLERNRWIMTLVGHHGHKPPGDWDGFLAYAQQLRTRTIYNAIKGAERLGGVARFGFPASVRRHFDRLEKFPPGLLPFGDAICRFNPVYGQGMSVAAQEACLLRELLRRRGKETGPLDGLAPAFFAEAETLIETPWALAAIPDYAVPETEGDRPDDLDQTLEFGAGLVQLAATDAQVHKLWTEVLHLLKPQSVLRDPEIVHALAVDRVEPAERIGDWQHAAGQARQSFEMLPGADRETIVTNAVRRVSVTDRVVHSRRDQ